MTIKKIWIIAITLGIFTTIFGYRYISTLGQDVDVQQNLVDVVFSTVDIKPNTRITEEMVQIKKVDSAYLPSGTFNDLEDVIGKINRWRILQGEPILVGRLSNPELQETKLAYKIPEGHRAISIVYSPVVGVGGYIKAGDYVDVVGSYENIFKDGVEVKQASEMILENILVLAVGTTMIPDEESIDGTAVNDEVQTVTLAVLPAQAERLVFTERFGSIRLLLRPILEKSKVTTPGTTPNNILTP